MTRQSFLHYVCRDECPSDIVYIVMIMNWNLVMELFTPSVRPPSGEEGYNGFECNLASGVLRIGWKNVLCRCSHWAQQGQVYINLQRGADTVLYI